MSKPGLRAEGSASGPSAPGATASEQATGQEPTTASQPRQPGEADAGTATAPEGATAPASSAPAGATAASAPAPAASAPPNLSGALAERTADLQRVQAEYANYRKRVERDRAAVREQALASVMSELLPVLDDIGRAREHGELTGGFKSVAESLEAITVKLGLTSFGKAGEAFDPNVHEALTLAYSVDVTEPTCAQILQPGYRVGDRVLRPARVVVAEPTDPAGARTVGDAVADPGQSDTRADRAEADEPGAAGADATDPGGPADPAGPAHDTN